MQSLIAQARSSEMKDWWGGHRGCLWKCPSVPRSWRKPVGAPGPWRFGCGAARAHFTQEHKAKAAEACRTPRRWRGFGDSTSPGPARRLGSGICRKSKATCWSSGPWPPKMRPFRCLGWRKLGGLAGGSTRHMSFLPHCFWAASWPSPRRSSSILIRWTSRERAFHSVAGCFWQSTLPRVTRSSRLST